MTKLIRNTNKSLPLVEVKGSHLQIGQQIGEAVRNQVQHSVENARTLLDDAYDELQLSWEGAQIQAKKYLLFAEERYPQYIDELRGIAAGANVEYTHLAVVNAIEAVTMDALHLTKCTSLALNANWTADDRVYIAHNEDWLPDNEPDVYLVKATPDDEPSFLAMTYGGLLPNVGFNSAGIAQCCDTVYPNDSRLGIPRVVVSRAVLAASTPGEAIRRMLVPRRAAGYNHLLAHESGELYNVEVSARHFAILYGLEGLVVHTNFYLDPKMQTIENEPEELIGTRVRYYRALRLLMNTGTHNLKTLQLIQKDHVNRPSSICNHALDGNPLDREKTIAAMIIDLTSRALHIAWGNPCENSYHTYYLSG